MTKSIKRIFAAIMLVAMLVTVVQVQPMEAQAASKKLTYGIYKYNGKVKYEGKVSMRVQIGIDKYSKRLVMNFVMNHKTGNSDADIETTFHLKKVKKGVYEAKDWWLNDTGYLYVYTKGKKITACWSYGHDERKCTLKLKKKKKYTVVAG